MELQTLQSTAMMPNYLTKPQKLSDSEPESFIKKIAEEIVEQNKDSEEDRTREWVTMAKRQRGSSQNLSDAIGVFSLDGRRWLDVPVSNIRIMNIFDPAIRANTTTQSQAVVALNIKPTTSTNKGAANVAEGINEYLDTTQWTEQTEFLVCERPQIAACVFLRSYFDKEAKDTTIKIPEFIETELEGESEFACAECGMTGMVSSSEAGEGYNCPDCGHPTELSEVSAPSFVPVPQFRQESYGASKTEIISSFEVRMDLHGTAGGQFQNGTYLEVHQLKTREYLESAHEYFKLHNASIPSYPLRWQHSLEQGLKTIKESWDTSKQSSFDLFERRKIYLKPCKYQSYRSPVSWSIRNEETGEKIWTIERGETWEEAIQRQNPKAKPAKGLVFTLIENKLACAPEFADFTEEFSIIQFAPDAFSAWGRPFSILLSIQNDVNDLNTIAMVHFEKNSIANVVVDTRVFDFEDFEQDFVPTREGAMIEGNISNHFAVVEPPRLGNEPIGYLQFLLSVGQNLSGVQPAAVGQAQPGTPYHAQLLQVNQSQGLLATALKSKAQGKVQWLKNHLKVAQRCWSEEQFEQVRIQYGAEWKDEDIQDFLECDLDKDILVSYVEGSEIPKTLIQREIKLQEFIAQVSQFAQLAPGTVTPQMMQELVAQLADYSDIEMDIGNFEGDKRLAEARYERIKSGVETFGAEGYQITPEMSNGITQVALRIIQQGKCTPNPKAENHALHKEYWADRIRVLQANDDIDINNELLLGICDLMWQLHDEAEVSMAQLMTINQMKAQEPMMQMQQAQQQQQMAQQAEIEGANQARQLEAEQIQSQQAQTAEQERQAVESARQNAQLADAQAQREQAEMFKVADLAEAERGRQFEREMLKNQSKKESK